MWLVIQTVDVREAGRAVVAAHGPWLAGGLTIFWLGICARILRWRCLLVNLANIKTLQVADALIVGYAMNYVLPARLGEPFRAGYTQKRYGIDTIAVFGSIIIERLLDGLIAVLILMLGLAIASTAHASSDFTQFYIVAGVGLAVFVGVAAVLILFRSVNIARFKGPKWLSRILGRFMVGVAALGKRDLAAVIIWTMLVWLLEISALWALFASLGMKIAFYQLLILIGVGALSTLIPTAPGYVGSLQLAFAAVMIAFAHSPSMGVAAATLVQAAFYSSLIIVAVLIVASRWLRTQVEIA
jgi:uncharacterized protein (TIRG00374 family)